MRKGFKTTDVQWNNMISQYRDCIWEITPPKGEHVKIVLAGGTGQIGTVLAGDLFARGAEVVVLSRRPSLAPWHVVEWDGRTIGAWLAEVESADVVINLAGRSVNCRYNATNRAAILNSRVDATRAIALALGQVKQRPRVWLQMSTATIYAHRHDGANDELTGVVDGGGRGVPQSWRFSFDVANAWESACNEARLPGVRKVVMRTAMVMSADRGGVFDVLLRLVRFGLGGQSGDGRQFISWIHAVDFVNAVRWLIATESADGVFNLASPNPLPNAEFMREIRSAWGAPFGLPATRWMLEVGALLMRTETELILKSRRVVPARLLSAGFLFQFPDWKSAVADLCARWRKRERNS